MDTLQALKVLGGYYQEEHIHTRHVASCDLPNGNKALRISMAFPPYKRTLRDQGHVGMSQMHEGLVEGLYCVVADAIMRGVIEAIQDLEIFVASQMKDCLFMREELTFRRMLKANEEGSLTLSVRSVGEALRQRYHSIIIEVDGFMRGEVECWLPKETPGSL
jgi:hypothetical protein